MARAAAKKRGFMDCYDKPGRRYDPATEGFGSPDEWRATFNAAMGFDEASRLVGKSDPLATLGLSAGATWLDVKRAFRALAMIWHPDRAKQNGKDEAEATERFKAINAAYVVLEKKMAPKGGAR